jgi:site-specific DNA-cytosine methylase
MLGNGWTVDVIAHILSFIPETYLHIVVSLFDGISCGQVALERAGKVYNQYYASEIDKYAIAVTQKNYPHTMRLGDVTKIDWNAFLDRLNLIQKVS